MFEKFHVRGPQRQRQIRRQRSGDTESLGHIHYGIDPDFFREFHGGDVT